MIGGVVLARAVRDPQFSDEILNEYPAQAWLIARSRIRTETASPTAASPVLFDKYGDRPNLTHLLSCQ
jgi:hypothetical protein